MDEIPENTREFRKILSKKNIYWLDVPRADVKRTVIKRGEQYWYVDEKDGCLMAYCYGTPEIIAKALGIMGWRER